MCFPEFYKVMDHAAQLEHALRITAPFDHQANITMNGFNSKRIAAAQNEQRLFWRHALAIAGLDQITLIIDMVHSIHSAEIRFHRVALRVSLGFCLAYTCGFDRPLTIVSIVGRGIPQRSAICTSVKPCSRSALIRECSSAVSQRRLIGLLPGSSLLLRPSR